jgi:N6-adenosine-specific RNA methylase IME4
MTNNDADIPAEIQRNKDNKAPFHDKPDAPKSGRLLPHKFADIFPLIESYELKELTADIKEHGLIEPITLYEGFILDGRNRYKAAFNAGLWPDSSNPPLKDHKFFDTFSGSDDEALSFVMSKNLKRRHLNESQLSMVGGRFEALKQGARTDLVSQDTKSGKSKAGAAETVGVSTPSIARARKVLKKGSKKLQAAVDKGDIPVKTAADIADLSPEEQADILKETETKENPTDKARTAKNAVKKNKRAKQEKALGAKVRALPTTKFGVILADPPWRYENIPMGDLTKSPESHYPTQSLKDILKLKVPSISAPNSVLFLWAVAPMLPEALQVMSKWGFTYKAHLIWHKVGKLGLGYWFRNEHELLLVGIKGKIPAPAPGTQIKSILQAKPGRHSEKPEEVLKLIEKLFPSLPKIELHRRGEPRKGWEAWGNESK